MDRALTIDEGMVVELGMRAYLWLVLPFDPYDLATWRPAL